MATSSGSMVTRPRTVYFFWPYAYCQGNGAWYYVNESDVHWVVDMTTGVWRILGYAP